MVRCVLLNSFVDLPHQLTVMVGAFYTAFMLSVIICLVHLLLFVCCFYFLVFQLAELLFIEGSSFGLPYFAISWFADLLFCLESNVFGIWPSFVYYSCLICPYFHDFWQFSDYIQFCLIFLNSIFWPQLLRSLYFALLVILLQGFCYFDLVYFDISFLCTC